MGIDISVVMTLHAEGRIAHRTFSALSSAITTAQQKGLSVEIVAVMDRVADSVLKQTVQHWSSIFNGILFVYEVDFGALSLSRNYGVSKSRGNYISIHDGDDLYGEHWLIRAHEVCTSDPRNIAHPEARFSFPIRPFMVLFPQNSFFVLGLIKKNQWSALTMAHRNIFTQLPYIKDDHNFAYQDWLWNCQTAAQGYQHVIVPKTMMAIRQKPPGRSLWQSSFAQYKVVRPNELYKKLFQGDYASLIAEAEESTFQFNIRKRISSFLERHLIRPIESFDTRYFKLYQFIVNFIKDLSRSIKNKINIKFLPDWLLEELDNLAKIEPTLSGYRAPRILTARPSLGMVRAINRQMASLVNSKSAKVYILDGLDDNALSVATLLYTRAVKKPVFVITTGKSKNICQDLLPDKSSHIDIGNANLDIDEKLLLLHRLLLESKLEFVHVIGSKIAFEMLHRHGGSFDRLNIFGTLDHSALVLKKDAIEWQGETYDQLVDHFTRIATNSSLIHAYLQRVFGLPEELVFFHQLPLSPDRHLSWDHIYRLNRRRMQRFLDDFPFIENEQNPTRPHTGHGSAWETFRRQADNFYYQRKEPG
jgi:glycosyltransferase involved in cell wall biosynthesis